MGNRFESKSVKTIKPQAAKDIEPLELLETLLQVKQDKVVRKSFLEKQAMQ